MWIIPQNYQPSSVSARDMVASSEDLSLPGINIEQSLMWRSKPSPLRTWLQRWKRDSWFRHLSGRILKPCQHTAFETELTCLLAVIPASRLAPLGFVRGPKTQGTYGHTSTTTYEQLDLFAASLRTSKDTSALDCETSLQTWKALVTQRRGEYSARLKSARLTRESGCTSWPTPQARDHRQGSAPASGRMLRKSQQKFSPNLNDSVLMWPTPSARDHKGGYQGGRIRNGKISKDTLDVAVQHTDNQSQSAGQLNPTWVEWLMGLPLGWTDLGSWGTE